MELGLEWTDAERTFKDLGTVMNELSPPRETDPRASNHLDALSAGVPPSAAPVTAAERINSIDVLRGVALSGVLLMNMQAFAMPFCAYMNPKSYRNDDPLNFPLWCINHVLADGKFITIFSMLFGAGIVLMTSRAKARTGRSLSVHYRRMFWMAIFGCMHGIFIWHGDIVLTYAVCGLFAYWFRNRSPRLLIIVSLALMGVTALLMANFDKMMDGMSPDELQKMSDMWSPSAEKIALYEATYRGGYLTHLSKRFDEWQEMMGFLMIFGGRVLGVMLLGMALFKSDVLSAARSNKFYATLMVIGFGAGLPLAAYGIYNQDVHGWTMEHSFGRGSLFNYAGSLFSAFGWIGVVMWMCRSDRWPGLKKRFAAVGQMAFTNYIMHSVICTTIFYGHGLGYFGRVGRVGQLLLVLAIVMVQLWYSPIWLKLFRFGPLEWAWRSLTYWKRQPFHCPRPA